MKVKGSVIKQEAEFEISKDEMSILGKFFNHLTPAFLKEEFGILHDNSKLRRFKNFIKISKEAESILRRNGYIPQPLPLKFSLPFIENASLEEDGYLQKKWANLLAHGSIKENLRIDFIVSNGEG